MEYYELYDLEHGGIIDEFRSKDEALSALMRMAQDGGRSAIAGLSLIKVEDGSRSMLLREQPLERAVMDRIPRIVSTAIPGNRAETFVQSFQSGNLGAISVTGRSVAQDFRRVWAYDSFSRRKAVVGNSVKRSGT
jgi:hypothetical protein